jgi:hypothetical protein
MNETVAKALSISLLSIVASIAICVVVYFGKSDGLVITISSFIGIGAFLCALAVRWCGEG